MAKNVIRISDKAAADDFVSLLGWVRDGAEVVIEHDEQPIAVVQSVETPSVGAFRGRLLSESIARADAHAKELGFEPTMDADFFSDLQEIINSRTPRDLSAWE